MRPQNRLAAEKFQIELRKYTRLRLDARMQISWLDEQGCVRHGTGNLVDISEGGFALELREAPRRHSRVRFVCSRLKLIGLGEVRGCGRRGNFYRVGVQFIEGSRWSPHAASPAGDQWDWGFPKS